MKLFKLVGLAGALLVVASMFLPVLEVLGSKISFMQSSPGLAIFFIVLAALSLVFIFIGKRWLSLISLFLSLAILLLNLNYIADAGDFFATGLFIMLAGSLILLVASLMCLFQKRAVSQQA
jgi:hypothetical protein